MAYQYLDPHHIHTGEDVELELLRDGTGYSIELTEAVHRPRHACLPDWHFDTLLDNNRTHAYERAIRQAIERKHLSGLSNVHVLDAGAGSGLLSMLAVRHGAASVSAVEFPGHVADLCEENLIVNGCFSKARVIHKAVKNVFVSSENDAELTSKADILAMEVFDCGLIGEGALHILKHAEEHLLHPDAIRIPCGASLFVQPIQLDRVGSVHGLDLSTLNARRWQPDYESLSLSSGHGHDLKPLSNPAMSFGFDFYDITSCFETTSMVLHFKATEHGILNAVLFWFELYLDDDSTLTTDPTNSESGTTWSPAVQWVKELSIKKGDAFQITATHDTHSFTFKALSSSICANDDAACPQSRCQARMAIQQMSLSLKTGGKQSSMRHGRSKISWCILLKTHISLFLTFTSR